MNLPPLYALQLRPLLERALLEDLGGAGDLTADAIVAPGTSARAEIAARRAGCIAGLDAALAAFEVLDAGCRYRRLVEEGAVVTAGERLAEVEGPARALLSAERTALNLLGRLSGIATATRSIVAAITGTSARVVCTRKTTPGLRLLEKRAVRAGGGANHRFGLDDAVLIKDNHVLLAGSVAEAVSRVRCAVGHTVKVEVEVDSLAQLQEALGLSVDAVLLDNMSLGELDEAVGLAGGRVLLEASGGITPESAPAIAATGVDLLAVGWITHSAAALDVGLDFLL